ncbi:MOSC domain-containing protein [Virgibacillus oceani]|uniref:Molybdenum cofactor sulfurase n=1 Tax=Virgibacillus oceani TaxID=1479511 RepID=A0A917HMX8_9BACI|nr:MOSC domain-containing protein [Virgibacillus oceani]GGG84704.1 molybdenum cofactor sulfurase [Virgibacillus oceani]
MEYRDNHPVGQVKEIRRFPVKSLLGESLSAIQVDQRGLIGDRLWAIQNREGKFGSGKTTRRFKRIDGLFKLQARYEGSVPVVTMHDGSVYRGDDPTIHMALSDFAGYPVTLAREEAISHFDEGPISIITSSSIRALSEQLGKPVDPRRFRANLLIDVQDEGFIEEKWLNHVIQIGSDVMLRVVAPLKRCVMVNFAQEELPKDDHMLRTLATNHDAIFGVLAKVEAGGHVEVGHTVNKHG